MEHLRRRRWQVTNLQPDIPRLKPGEWTKVRLSHQRGSVASITLTLSTRGLWRWQWEEEWMGMKTILRSPTAYRHRPDCVASLCRALLILGLSEVAHDMATWE